MTLAPLPKVTISCDGSCAPTNPGNGGWGALFIYENGSEEELCGGIAATTNNCMELTAVIEALRHLEDPSQVTVYSDSSYVIKAFTEGWLAGWKKRGWKRKDGELLNVDLWRALDAEVSKHVVEFRWVKGHAGNELNERADKLADRGRVQAIVPSNRQREKEASREEDERALASGEKSAEQLNRENGHFARLNAVVDFSGSRERTVDSIPCLVCGAKERVHRGREHEFKSSASAPIRLSEMTPEKQMEMRLLYERKK